MLKRLLKYAAFAVAALGAFPVFVGAVAAATATDKEAAAVGVLQGQWVRPDGGYRLLIKRVDAEGKLEAAYVNPNNPNPLPFSRAEATHDGKAITVFLELRAGGYNGSTYTLDYDAEKDVLKGVYYQAVAQQRYDIYFVRAK